MRPNLRGRPHGHRRPRQRSCFRRWRGHRRLSIDRGAAWACALIPIKVQADTNQNCGYVGITDTSILLAFQYAVQRGARIANCSWGHEDSPAQFEAFKALDQAGVVAVVAAGNFCCDIDSNSPPCSGSYPARYTFANMIVVGASNPSDQPWTVPPPAGIECGSNFGMVSVDLFAPGENIRVLSTGDSLTSCTATATGTYQTGTSYAAPLVSGVAALVWAANPTFSAHDVVTRLRSTARPVPALGHLCVSGGVLDASAALGMGRCVP